MDLHVQTTLVKQAAANLGFSACGIVPASWLERDALFLETWLTAGFHADMKWMENHFEKRTNPSKLVDDARSVIVLLQNYFPKTYPFEHTKYKISRYALGADYHSVIKDKLHLLLSSLKNEIPNIDGRCFVDSAPVLERALAREAGLGWMGKHSLLLNKTMGSYFFIGEIIVNTEFEYDKPVHNHCGTCKKCVDACPTQAIVSNGVVDSNRCLSYHTIENRGEIPQHIRENIRGRIFGCDICQEVCPWNSTIAPHNESNFLPSKEFASITEMALDTLTENDFNNLFSKSAVKRSKYKGFMRNINAASQNIGI